MADKIPVVDYSRMERLKPPENTVIHYYTFFRQSAMSGNMTNHINCYSFSLKPEEHQPSGTCNFSRIDKATLEFDNTVTLNAIYAVNYNVLRIMSGMGGLAYSN